MTEQQLIKGCIKKDPVCQRMLFEQYAGRLMTVCMRYAADQHEAEDILQESFMRVFNYIHQFRFEGSLEGWLKKIVVNTALRIIQKKKIHFQEITDRETSTPAVDPTVMDRLSVEELIQLIHRLPDGYRLVFNLYVLEGYDHNEIAGLLNINPGTSRSQLAKARKLLQDQINTLIKLPNGYV